MSVYLGIKLHIFHEKSKTGASKKASVLQKCRYFRRWASPTLAIYSPRIKMMSAVMSATSSVLSPVSSAAVVLIVIDDGSRT